MPPHTTHLIQPLDVVCFQPYKHYHAKALDLVVREGCVNITKLEFLEHIQDVRKKALRTSNVQSAFRKPGIYPFKPEVVLDQVQARLNEHEETIDRPTTPNQPINSSPFATPLTIRKLIRVGERLENKALELSPITANAVQRFVKGATVQALDLVQHKHHLSRTKLAETTRKARNAAKKGVLQTGGVLSVADGRKMIKNREEIEFTKSLAAIERHKRRLDRLRKIPTIEAAAVARKWRLEGRLAPAYVTKDDKPGKFLVKF